MNGIPGIVLSDHLTRGTFFGISRKHLSQQATSIEGPVVPLNSIPRLMPSIRQHPETHKASNVTNSTDPEAIVARVFVGNLNTLALNKKDVQSIFGRYGHIIGLSLHKGYAFVQYNTDVEARNAVSGESKRIYAGQKLDLNLTSEPKVRQTKRKRSLDDNLRQSTAQKRSRLVHRTHIEPHSSCGDSHQPRPDLLRAVTNGTRTTNPRQSQYLKQNGHHDILICGTCKEMFSSLDAMIRHKKVGCRLQFSCRRGPQTIKDIASGILVTEVLTENQSEPFTNDSALLHNYESEPDNCSLSSDSQISDISLATSESYKPASYVDIQSK